MASGPITSWQMDGETVADFIFVGSKITADGDCSHEIKRYLLLGRKVMTNLDSILKNRDITLSTKVSLVKAMVFPVVMYGCKSWTVKKAERRNIDAFELWCWRRLESPLDCKEIQPVRPKGDQSWVFFGRTDAKAETPVLWPSHVKSWLIGKDSDAGRDWGQEEKGTTEDEMAGWHHWLDGHESEWTPGVGDGQGGPACCNSWGRKESDTTERLNWTELNVMHASLVAQMVKRLSAMWETRVRSLGQEDPWRRKWQPNPVLLPGKFYGQRILVGYSPWGRKESDTTEQLHFLSSVYL